MNPPAFPPLRLRWRPRAAADAAFLDALYLASRPDLGALPVPRGVIEGIARHQRQLQAADYARRFPGLEEWVIEEAGRPAARLALERGDGRAPLRVVDLSVAPQARRRGIAATILGALQDRSAPGQGVALRVRADNAPARALYARLGFTLLREDAAALELVWIRDAAGAAQNE